MIVEPNVKVQNIESISLNKSTKVLTYHSENYITNEVIYEAQ